MSAAAAGPAGGSVGDVLRRAWLRSTAYVVTIGVLSALVLGLTLGVLQPRLARDTALRADLRQLHAGLLDQETGLRGYLPLGDERLLVPYRSGVRTTQAAGAALRRDAAADPAIATVLATARQWEVQWAGVALARSRPTPSPASAIEAPAFLERGRVLFDAYRAADTAALRSAAQAVRADQRDQKILLTTALVVIVGSLAGTLGLSRRGGRRMLEAIEAPVRDLTSSVRALGTEDADDAARTASTSRTSRTDGTEDTDGADGAEDTAGTGQNAARRSLRVPAEFAELDRQLSGAARRLAAGRTRIGALLDVQQVIATASLDEAHVIELVVGQAHTLTGADAAVLELADGDDMVHVGVAGSAESLRGLRLPMIGSASGLSASTGQTLRIDDTRTDQRVNQAACQRAGAGSMLLVPLRSEGDLAGVLKVYAERPNSFDDSDERTLDLLAGLAAVALQNARTHGEIVASRSAALLNASRFRMLFDQSPVGQVEMTAGGTILGANDTFGAMLGWAPGSLVGVLVRDLVHIDDAVSLDRDLAGLLSGASPAHTSRRIYRHLDGHRVIARVSVAPMIDADGSTRLVGTAIDITASERAAASLGESERRFRTIFDASPIGIVQFDSDGRLAQSNEAFALMLGLHRLDLIGSRAELLFHDEDIDAVRSAMTEVWAGSARAPRLELRLLRDSGRVVWASVSMTSVEHDGDAWLLMHAEDITARKATDDRLAHLALHDALTGLPNRVAALDRLEVALLAAERARTPVHVLFIDLDGFKTVNDTHGHAAGDRVLVEVATRIRSALRPGDTAARLAGDEFVVICPGVPDEATARVVSARLAAAITAPMTLGEVEVAIGASIGTCLSTPGQAPESVLALADAEMYERKRARQAQIAPATG